MILRATVALYFILTYYFAAKKAGKNGFVWALVGGGLFLVVSTYIIEVSKHALVGVVIGIALGIWITLKVRNRYFPAAFAPKPSEVDNLKQKYGLETTDLMEKLEVHFEDGKYLFRGSSFESLSEALTTADSELSD
jgi:hypothetical protein